ncbi:MAG TPA: gamma-glutamyl-gamma-aminobutyrate hydrolase family protein, partial [Solirubrobacteraceae bacterium]|nr:gamma-glutamyl-gamma-aminobutyrate hydrolase family protein [Solirubrobacteraceae bacterium]
AICRGMQAVNVARGGTLHQHLPDVVGEQINHRQDEPAADPTHWVTLMGDSQLRRILGRSRTKVNSFHHQAVDELGERLVITGRARDGTVESLEATDREFLLGVQWHAECMVARAEQAALFRSFVEAAERFERGGDRFARAA